MPQRTGAPGELVTVPGVELTRTGRWATSTGVFDFTREDFEAAIAAAGDPEVWEPPVKIGHTDPRFASLSSMDGEPALGWVSNLRIRDDGGAKATLIGDLVNVPAALARIIPSAYKRRSIELAFGVKTPSGKQYRAAVVGLALLGVQAPAVAGLADVLKLYEGDATFELAAAASDATHGVLVVEASGTVEERVAALESAVAGGAILITDPAGRHTDLRVEPTPPGGAQVPMTDERIRELLGLEAEADLEAALTQLRASSTPATPAAGDPATPTVPTVPADPATPGTPAAPGAEPVQAPATQPPTTPAADHAAAPATDATGAPVPVAAGAPAPAGFTLVDTATAQRMQELIETDRVRQREGLLAAAARQGRLAPTAVETWRAALDRDMVANAALLASQPAVFGTIEIGHAEGVAAAATPAADEQAWDAFFAELGA